eukprot:6100355-Prymnesium_polylepis.1
MRISLTSHLPAVIAAPAREPKPTKKAAKSRERHCVSSTPSTISCTIPMASACSAPIRTSVM